MSESETPDLTASIIAQLRDLIVLLETTPGLPLGRFGITDVRYHAEAAAEVDEAARILGVSAEWNEKRTHYRAERRIGPNVSYEALFITPEHSAAYREHMAGFHHGETEGEDQS